MRKFVFIFIFLALFITSCYNPFGTVRNLVEGAAPEDKNCVLTYYIPLETGKYKVLITILYSPGTKVRLIGDPSSRKDFLGWFTQPDSGRKVSDLVIYTNTNLYARYGTAVDAQVPSITKQPTGATYSLNGKASPLTVEASVSDGGVLSYQWFKDNKEISGAVDSSFTPSTSEAGSSVYYVKVTNTLSGATGNTVASVDSEKVTVKVSGGGSSSSGETGTGGINIDFN